jgi:uncharacterized protein (DUF362 family)
MGSQLQGQEVNKHEIYSQDSTVHLVSGEEKIACLHQAMEQSGFVPNLLDRWNQSGKSKDDFLIAIKPNIMTASKHEEDSPVYTDPNLVEELIATIRGEGFSQTAVVEAENVYNYSYSGRRVAAVAEMCGYSGNGYRIASMTEEKTPLDYGGLLGEHVVGKTWLDADYRISFAKNKTHWQCYYTACIKNVYGCLPEWDKMRFYHGTRHGKNIEFSDATLEIVGRLPVHFGFLDAWVSGDGLTGHVHDANPNHTRTILASENILALDWVAGEKMNLHPLDNVVIQKAVNKWGTVDIQRVGDMTPWPNWNNVRPYVIKILDVLEEYYGLSRFMSRTMAAEQDPRFKPVSRFHQFFDLAHKIILFFESLTTHQIPEGSRENTIQMTMSKV